ncbi:MULTISPECIES: hypothetical protein [unclassified Bradyrhizobium]|uniref:hypothetical protein n=1 Tax=unclassified Bradyrhizobium TaxID=2631580 RepID=UPI002FEFF0B1
MQGVKEDLLRDIERYTCGEQPSPIEMLRAPKLENWSARIGRRGKEFVLLVYGNVHKHRDHADGDAIKTSAVAWFDRHARWVRTHERLWVLGKQRGDE